MDLQDVFRFTNLKCVVSIDDDWNYHNTAEAVLYDIYQLPSEDKNRLLTEIQECDEATFNVLENAITEMERIGFESDGKAKYKIYRYISDERALNTIKAFLDTHVKKIETISKRYGVGLKSAGVISLKDTIATAREMGIPIRVYTDFSAQDKAHFERSVSELTSNNGYVFCIIDDHMQQENRADEILKLIADNAAYQKKVGCVLVTSGNNSNKARYDSNIHVEFIQKQTVTTKRAIDNFNKQLSMAYLKSLYRVMLANLQIAKKEAIDTVFENLYKDVDTAIHISTMARIEGVTNFEMINKWIFSKERNEIEEQRISDIKNIIALSNVLNNLQESTSIRKDETGNELYSNDSYDKTVNILHKMIDVGDVFDVNGSYYVLIGQECDLGLRSTGERKTEVLEFVAAHIYDSATEIIKNQFTYEQAIIANFPTEDGSLKYLTVNCGKRYYAKPEVFDICTYNCDGKSIINISKPLEQDVKTLLSEGLINLYAQIQQHFQEFSHVKQMIEDEQLFKSFVKIVGLSNEKNQVIGYDEYLFENDTVTYPIRRVCRLRKHAQLLHRMYLNYRGRQAEEAVCFSRYIEIDYKLGDSIFRAKCLLSSKSNSNEEHKLYKRPWVVKTEDINHYLNTVGKAPINMGECFLELPQSTTSIAGCRFKKYYDKLSKMHFISVE